ncbi:hypothetical protein [Deinococcus cellulosilyticus]|uniref:AAA+ ATPase domain-containing protein n=1 Tax=Deinococcus cellulosilyticus (strain DSM 18568 / NBRC 106333 / KACC 11606 / 5516J-15) TaxID=1223518 RepID=A0A511NAJ8_DEIC1|nr:hypothetical protein [Deinococcus cellulosilyticus]GEM49830.1 hypothetical protein DC3_54650 [Deinococcus cellulosilyticus NBRC 106333 = KACC 11606]
MQVLDVQATADIKKGPFTYPILNQEYDLAKFKEYLPRDIRECIGDEAFTRLEEIKIRYGMPLWVLIDGKYRKYPLTITRDHLQFIASKCKTFRDDNRRGIEGTGHRISRVMSAADTPLGYTFRMGRFFGGIGEHFRKFIEEDPSMLIIGQAGLGKTTILRGILSVAAEYMPMQTVIVDTSGEVTGDGDIQHPGIGDCDRLPVKSKAAQAGLIEEATKNQNPRIIGVDEINRQEEAEFIRNGLKSGSRLIGTTHGKTLYHAYTNQNLLPLFEPEPVFYWAVVGVKRGEWEVFKIEEALKDIKSGHIDPRGTLVHV